MNYWKSILTLALLALLTILGGMQESGYYRATTAAVRIVSVYRQVVFKPVSEHNKLKPGKKWVKVRYRNAESPAICSDLFFSFEARKFPFATSAAIYPSFCGQRHIAWTSQRGPPTYSCFTDHIQFC